MSKMLHTPSGPGDLARVIFHEFDESGQLPDEGWDVEAMVVEKPEPVVVEEVVTEPAPVQE